MTLTTVNPALLDTQAQYTGFKNRIVNGAMVIDQRNAGASVSVTTGPFTLDRWAAQTPTGGSVQQITSTITGFVNSFKYTASASNAYYQMGQQIEYLNCYDLQNVTVAISFWAKANNSNTGSTALTVRTRTVAGINGIARFTGANVDTSVTITTSAVQYTVTRTLPATFGALSLEFVLGANVSGDGFEITGVQLEKGSTATSFDYRPYGTELQLCQRYFEKLNFDTNASYDFIMLAASNTTTTATAGLYWQVSKRATPTVSTSAANSFRLNITGGSDGTVTQINASNISIINAVFSVVRSGQVVGNSAYVNREGVVSPCFISASAEL